MMAISDTAEAVLATVAKHEKNIQIYRK